MEGTVVAGMVGGSDTTVVGLLMLLVGGASVVSGGGGSVVAVVVCTGADVWVGALVPVLRGWVVTTEAWVVAVVPPGPGATVVVVSAGVEVEDDEVGAVDGLVVAGRVVVRRTVVEGAWVATCCFAEVSLPVATSNRRATKAMDARA